MEGRLKFIVGILILAVVISQGMKILEKKALRKSKLAAVASTKEKKSPSVTSEVSEETPAAAEIAPVAEIVPEKVPEVAAKLSLADLEAEAKLPFCESDWEKSFCPRIMTAMMSVKGTRILNHRLIVFVDNDPYLSRADRYLNPPIAVDPTKPVEFIPPENQMKNEEKKITIAGALFIKELLQSFKSDVIGRNLEIVFLKNPSSPVSKNTFALECSDSSLESVDLENTFSEEKFKNLSVDISQICRRL